MNQSQPSLPTNCAFVVQFRPQPAASLCGEGRVEHLVSGETVRFHSSEELMAFLSHILTKTD